MSPNKARQAYLRAERELKRAEHDLKEVERAWRITSRLRDDACERYETAMDHAGAEEVLALAQKRGLLIVEGVVDGAA